MLDDSVSMTTEYRLVKGMLVVPGCVSVVVSPDGRSGVLLHVLLSVIPGSGSVVSGWALQLSDRWYDISDGVMPVSG